jgi:ribose 1,5-bisphosphokinase PhnN
VDVIDPIELNPLSQGFGLDEQSNIVDVDWAQWMIRSLSPVRYESWSNDVSNVSQAALKKVQRRFARLAVIAMTTQRIEGIEKAA